MTKIKSLKFILVYLLLPVILLPLFCDKAFAMEAIQKVLSNTNTPGLGQTVATVWNRMMGIVDAVLILALIVIAFAQILRLNVNSYGIKKVLPSLVLAVLAAHFSFLICRLVLDMANVFLSPMLEKSSGMVSIMEGFATNIGPGGQAPSVKPVYTTGNAFWFFLSQCLTIAGAIGVYILAYLFIIRNWVMYFLVALSPLGFIAIVLPQTKSLFNQWWSNFVKWAFMPVVSVFWLWAGSMWASVVNSDSAYFMKFIFATACLFFAITTPFKMGGAIAQKWGDLGKKAWGATAGNAWKYTGGAAMNQYKELWKLRAAGFAERNINSKQRLNPIRGLLKNTKAREYAIEKEKETLAQLRDDSKGKILSLDKRLQDRYYKNKFGNRGFGGGTAEAEAALDKEFFQSKKGEEYLDGRQMYISNLAALQSAAKIAQSKAEMNFLSAKGKWGQDGTQVDEKTKKLLQMSDQYKIRQDFLGTKAEETLRANQIKKIADDELERSLSEKLDVMNINDEALTYENIFKSRQDAIALRRANKNREAEGVEAQIGIEIGKLEEKGLKRSDIERDITDHKQVIENRRQELQKKLEAYKDKDGKLVVPYEFRTAVKLSDDGKSIKEILGFSSLGPAGVSRINAELSGIIDTNSTGQLKKYSIAELGNRLKNGAPGEYEKKDIEKYREGKMREISPVVKSKIKADQRAFMSAMKSNPNSTEFKEFLNSIDGLIPPDRAKVIAHEIKGDIQRAYAIRQFGVRELTSLDSAQKIKIQEDMVKANIDQPAGMSDSDYIQRVLQAGQSYKQTAVAVIKRDPNLGTDKPMTYNFSDKASRPPEQSQGVFAGQGVGQQFASSVPGVDYSMVESSANQLNRVLAKTASDQISKIASAISSRSKSLGVMDSELLNSATRQISQARIKFTKQFAKDLGISMQMTPAQREGFMQELKKLQGKSKNEIQKSLQGVLGQEVNLPDQVTITDKTGSRQVSIEEAVSSKSSNANQLDTAMNNLEKVRYDQDVNNASQYVGGMGAISRNFEGKDSEEKLSNFQRQIEALQAQLTPDKTEITGEMKDQITALFADLRGETQLGELSNNIDKLRIAVAETNYAAKAAQKSIDKTGNIDPAKAKDALYDVFLSERSNIANVE